MLLKTDDVFRLFVLPADRQLDTKKIKQELKVKSTRFATSEELLDLAGLVPGSVPPFGIPVLPFELYGDTAIGAIEDKVAFNAGSLTTIDRNESVRLENRRAGRPSFLLPSNDSLPQAAL